MLTRKINVNSFLKLAAAAFVAFGAATTTRAESPDPSGLWKWTTPGRNGGPERVFNLKLEANGENLTGALLIPSRTNEAFAEFKISDGKIQGGTLSFSVVRPGFNGGNPVTTKYTGKFTADVIDGQSEGPGRNGGAPAPIDWKAQRNTTGKLIAGAKIVLKPGYDENGHKIVNETHYKEIPVAGATQFLVDHPDAIILDVRTPAEFAAGHLANAKNYSVADDKTYADLLGTLDKSKWYLVHSAHGAWRTVRTFEYFEANGFEHAVAIDGGYQAWTEAGKPTVKEVQQQAKQ
jgi:rhodanese-related sulfurtransferase